MKLRPLLTALGLSLLSPTISTYAASPTEGVVTHEFVAEDAMKSDILQMLADFTPYIVNDWQECTAPNSVGESCGCFRGESTMNSNEQGVRPNADLSMICAFLVKYGKDKVTLPTGVTWDKLQELARKSLVFSYSTHKANKLKVCADSRYWGSTSSSDNVWESSLWAMSVAYSAFFQWDSLSDAQKGYIEALLVAECNYELQRNIPSGYNGDTKAEENGWEADVLAAALGMFPNHANASKWFDRLREFAINSYSHKSDATDNTVIDPGYDNKTVAQCYKGQNLFDDYTLQNHSFFHTSYQNVVMQELGEAALALKLFQTGLHGTEKWKTNALMHNNREVMDEVLNWLALADGELAMPNGNDWSLFLFDQITSYTTMACFMGDADALMLENMAYKNIKARQKTTSDGSWLLRADVGARRMGVEAHRVMMTWLMHHVLPTASITPTSWNDFNRRYSAAKIFTSQNIVRASSDSRFSCFSWSSGKNSYTGYIASTSPDKNKIIVPFRANDTGNFLGWYDVQGKSASATPVVPGYYQLKDNAFAMNGEINTNGTALNNRFVIYSTPGNAVIYLDLVRANSTATVNAAHGGMMAISVDEFTSTKRNIKGADKSAELDGNTFTTFATNWASIDDEVGFVSTSTKAMAFGNRSNNNSIYTARFEPLYSNEKRSFTAGQTVDRRNVVYYSRIDAATTKTMYEKTVSLADRLPEGYNGIVVPDPDGSWYVLIANFNHNGVASLDGLAIEGRTPLLTVPTSFDGGRASINLNLAPNRSIANAVRYFATNTPDGVSVMVDPENDNALYIKNDGAFATLKVEGNGKKTDIQLPAGASVRFDIEANTMTGAEFPVENGTADPTKGYTDITSNHLNNTSFEADATYGTTGSVTLAGTKYDPCYVNDVAATNSNFPNMLPVQGWEAKSTLATASKYARMYSMPYSSSMYCVSPSTVGNYTAQCQAPFGFEGIGDRVLTVLNSWTNGDNRIIQSTPLAAGEYRVLINAMYECPNQASADGRTVSVSGNVNSSLTGIKVNGKTDYRYPTERNVWETLVYDFELTAQGNVEISLGYNTSAGVGAANNTLMYIDNVRLLRKGTESGIQTVADAVSTSNTIDVVNASGIVVRRGVNRSEALQGLPSGFYIAGGKKVVVR